MEEITSLPGLIGVVKCDDSGEIESYTGEEAEMLGTIVPYFCDLANLVGESFGLDEVQEATLVGKNITCVIVPTTEDTGAYIFESKAKIKSLLDKILAQ